MNKKSKNNKLLLGLLLLPLILIACEFKKLPAKVEEEQNRINEIPVNYSIVIIDSCEYIENKSNNFVLTHKGNCRFCIERAKKIKYNN